MGTERGSKEKGRQITLRDTFQSVKGGMQQKCGPGGPWSQIRLPRHALVCCQPIKPLIPRGGVSYASPCS